MKMKKLIVRFFIIFSASFLNYAQVWSTYGSGLSYPVNSMVAYNNNLYAASYGVVMWNSSQWVDLSDGLQALFGSGDVYSIEQYNGSLFAGGSFTVFNPQNNWYNNAARYNGTSWGPCGSGLGNDESGMSDYVNFLLVYNNELYAGGNFTSAGGEILNPQDALYIAKFNGTQWLPVGGGTDGKVTDMVIYNGELVVSGYFATAGSVSANYIAKWNGVNWSALGSGTDGKVTALSVHNGELYAGGLFQHAGGVSASNIAKWNGQSWSAVGSGIYGDQIYTLASLNSELYAGGNFSAGSGNAASYIMRWDGSQWKAVGSGTDGYVLYLLPFDSKLIVGGSFSTAGGLSANNIASISFATDIDDKINAPEIFSLFQNYPNPFNPGTSIQYVIGSRQFVSLKVYDVLGTEVAVLVNEEKPAGNYKANFSTIGGASQLSSGIYFYKLTAGSFTETKKMLLLK
jgi:hypothetical protein